MAQIPPELAPKIAARHGVVTHADLTRSGLSAREVRRLVGARQLVTVHRATYRVAFAWSPSRPAAAACVAWPGLAMAATTAGRFWGFRGLGRVTEDERLVALVAGTRQVVLRGVEVRRSLDLQRSDVVRRSDGITLTNPVRTLLDLSRDLNDIALESIAEQLVSDRACSAQTIIRAAERWARPSRPGAARVRRALLTDRPGRSGGPAGSDLELRVLRALIRRGVPVVSQHPLTLPNGRRVRLDAADPAHRWCVEVNHHHWHTARLDSDADEERRRQLHLLGWQVDDVSDLALRVDFAGVIDQLVALHAQRSSRDRAR
ncbi:MAG: hypothetical protein R2715_02030 [Ilumatobacteraceae bacterium]